MKYWEMGDKTRADSEPPARPGELQRASSNNVYEQIAESHKCSVVANHGGKQI